jgi:hypothetical protein
MCLGYIYIYKTFPALWKCIWERGVNHVSKNFEFFLFKIKIYFMFSNRFDMLM